MLSIMAYFCNYLVLKAHFHSQNENVPYAEFTIWAVISTISITVFLSAFIWEGMYGSYTCFKILLK